MDDLLGLEHPIRGYTDENGNEMSGLTYEEIQELKTPFLFRAFTLFSEWQVFGVLPHGRGTLDEPPAYIDAMMILKDEDNQWQMWEMENQRKR